MQLGSASNRANEGNLFATDAASAVKSDINVTPLVDVCLVLLIIFMVVTPLLQSGHSVQLPETDQPEKMPEGAKQLDVAIEQDGSVFVGDKWITGDQLLATFQEIHDRNPEKNVVIKADSRLKYAEVRKLMKVINQAGFGGAGLVTHKKGVPAGPS
jgi:biopolymer transport protein ExbD